MYLPTTVSTPLRVHCRTLTWQLHPSGTSNNQYTPPPRPPPHPIPTTPPPLICTFPHPPHPNPIFPSTNTLIPLPDNMKPATLKPSNHTSAWCPSRGFALQHNRNTEIVTVNLWHNVPSSVSRRHRLWSASGGVTGERSMNTTLSGLSTSTFPVLADYVRTRQQYLSLIPLQNSKYKFGNC